MAEPEPLTHERLWAALDRLAADAGLSASGLARRAGLDPTTFNRSKRIGKTRAARWPSTESIAKVLASLDVSFADFAALVTRSDREVLVPASTSFMPRAMVKPPCEASRPGRIPILRPCSAGKIGHRERKTTAWLDLDTIFDQQAFAIPLSLLSDPPPTSDKGHLVITLQETCATGDLVALGLRTGRLMAGSLARQSTLVVVLEAELPAPEREIACVDIEWMGRIVLQHHQ